MKLFSTKPTTAKINDAVSKLTPFLEQSLIQALLNKDPTVTEIIYFGSCAQSSEDDEVKFGNEEAIALMLLLKNNSYVTKVDLTYNNITASGVAEIVKNPFITSLDLSLGNIDEESARLISENSNITDLSLGDTHLSTKVIKHLAKSASITTLRLNGCGLTDDSAKILAGNNIIRTLNVCCNNFTAAAGKSFAKNTKLRNLNIGCNPLGDEGVAPFITNLYLKTLNIEGTKITHQCANRILRENKVIKNLDLSMNALGEHIMSAIAQNSTLRNLRLIDFDSDDSSKSEISDAAFATLFQNHSIIDADIEIPAHLDLQLNEWLDRNNNRVLVDNEASIPPAAPTSRVY